MIINFHFMQYFSLEHDEFISCKYFVTFYDDFELGPEFRVIIIGYNEF